MPAHLTHDSESSSPLQGSILRSPKASEGQGGALGEAEALRRGNTVGVRDQIMDLVAEQGLKVSRVADNVLMPTPTLGHIRNYDEPVENYLERRQDFINGKTKGMPGASLGVAIRMEQSLLPTVTTQDGKNNGGPSQFERNTKPLNTEVLDFTNWGKFQPAIRRWEQTLGRPAPAPTQPDGKEGAHRLSPWFTEWMMGLPEGWICDPEIGLTRNEQLKACGNGVVPQQAELALRILLDGVDLTKSGGGQVNLPTPTVSDIFTSNLKSSQQKEGSMHSVTLPQVVERMI